MDLEIKKRFMEKWEKYFPGSDLPIACYYADKLNGADFTKAPKPNKKGYTCIFSQMAPVRLGKPGAFNQENFGCWGASGLFGFIPLEADDYMVDCLVNVERFKKSEEHVKGMFAANPPCRPKESISSLRVGICCQKPTNRKWYFSFATRTPLAFCTP